MDDWKSRGMVWVVVFDLDVPPDRVISPDVAAIIIDQKTGEADFVELL